MKAIICVCLALPLLDSFLAVLPAYTRMYVEHLNPPVSVAGLTSVTTALVVAVRVSDFWVIVAHYRLRTKPFEILKIYGPEAILPCPHILKPQTRQITMSP